MSKTQKKVHKKPPPDESKSARFKRVVTPRIGKAVKSIGLICNCSGSSYEYSESEVEQITEVLFAAVNRVIESFKVTKSEKSSFTFKDS